MSTSSDAGGRGKNRRKWSIIEDELALDFVLELKGDPQWKCKGSFNAGFFKQLESMFEKKFPGIGLKASQIEAKVKFLKEKYSVIHEMTKLSGFSWDENTNMINCEKQAYLDFCKLHTRAKGLYSLR